jgi:hypothetical protein
MIQSNKIFRTHSGCWDYDLTNEPKYSKKPIFKHFFFMLNRTKKQIGRINGIQIYGVVKATNERGEALKVFEIWLIFIFIKIIFVYYAFSTSRF